MRSTTFRGALGLLGAFIAITLPASLHAQEPSPSFDVELSSKGLEVKSAGGNFKLRVGGRLQVDSVWHEEDDQPLEDTVDIRRARVYIKTQFFKRWDLKGQADFKDGDADLKDLYLRYSGAKGSDFTLGNFKEPFSLEEQTSSKHITFLERSLPVAAFSPGRAVGMAFHRGRKAGSTTVGVFGEPISGSNNLERQGYGVAARITRAPVAGKRKVFHLGVAGEYRVPRPGEKIRFDTTPESSLTDEKLVRTRRLDDLGEILKYGYEVALTTGPISLQGEYIQVDVHRRQGEPDVSLSGWYAFASWFPTGESRPYKGADGAFGQVKPRHKGGALELALRFSSLDLDDPAADGGQEDNITFALSWYLGANLRFMANYIDVDSTRRGDSDNPNIFLLRAQVTF